MSGKLYAELLQSKKVQIEKDVMMQTYLILLKDNTPLESVEITDEFAHLLRFDQVREQMGLVYIPNNDVRVRNLSAHANQKYFSMSLQDFRHFIVLSSHYQKMKKVITHYSNKFSPKLIDALVGNIDNLYRGLLSQQNPPTKITVANIPNIVLNQLKYYFFSPFLITSAKLSQGKYDNVKFLDGTAEFRIIFTIADVALPQDKQSYELQSLTFDIFGKYYNNEFIFSEKNVRIDRERLLRYDDELYQNRKAYLHLVLTHAQDEQGNNLQTVLENVAKQFVNVAIES